jgi:multimeric flavodoxin WrbA
MMKVIAFNGSPRRKWNTAMLLSQALEGAASQGAETELIHLYDYNYKGCISCFACKLKDGKSYGRCAVKDDLKPFLEKAEQADVILIGSPIYFGAVTGEVRSFLERLMFPYLVYDANYSTLFNRKIATGFIYTMNVGESRMIDVGYDQLFKSTEMTMGRIFGAAEYLTATDTYQFDDYAKYEVTAFDEHEKQKRRQEVFPKDCQKAFEMGSRLVQKISIS